VREAFLRRADITSIANKNHFFRAAAVATRRIQVDRAREERAEKWGGGLNIRELSGRRLKQLCSSAV
jgi:hypothetical protein